MHKSICACALDICNTLWEAVDAAAYYIIGVLSTPPDFYLYVYFADRYIIQNFFVSLTNAHIFGLNFDVSSM